MSMENKLEQDLLKVFEAGKKCVVEHPDDDSYDKIHFERVLEKLSPEMIAQISEAKKPTDVKEAEKYIRDCENDLGFMGSPEYYKRKKVVQDYHKSLTQN